MSFLVALLLGIVQGITEFLPISSSGHLMIVEKLCGAEIDSIFLNVILHLATLLAVCLFYRKTLLYMIKHPLCKLNQYLLVATLPAVVFVLLFGILLGDFLSSAEFVGVGFLVSAVFLTFAQIVASKNQAPQKLGWKGVLTMGFSQALALFPGVSRSGTTFAFGVASGLEKNQALDFSFLMSIPIILASLVYELVFSGNALAILDTHWLSIVISFISAFLTALLGLVIMQKLVRKISFWWFVPYLIIMGILILIFL